MGRGNKYFLICKLWYLQAADPWLWLAGLSVCRKREGVPLPRSGGGREGADASAIPYKHRLAHDPGGRRPSGRAFRCVGFLGRSPKPFLHPFVGTKGCPAGQAYQPSPFGDSAPPTGEMKLSRSLCQQPLRLISFATSLYTREAFAARWPQIVPRNKLIFPVNHSLISPILM